MDNNKFKELLNYVDDPNMSHKDILNKIQELYGNTDLATLSKIRNMIFDRILRGKNNEN